MEDINTEMNAYEMTYSESPMEKEMVSISIGDRNQVL